ncbi:glycine zipper 2TM domain-containing protein [Caenimonas sedimenti]|uniref:Glycine zipper 2TM domain-containing protein n=1 Tax=Caenimonas sedimenti TaxID=2596921 RepID=A0A562ZTD7_9BURK|nr:beta/gamma crystallin-related protein [Caenimonas sedimenti]TWO71872.1 glycine zipper 2TM domain-containing protein [Caenimonas sedimenti]
MQIALKAAVAAATLVLAGQSMAQIVLYEEREFRGRAVTVDRPVRNLDRMNFDDRTRSVVVERGRWEVCEEPRFEGRCAVLRRGHYDSLRDAGVNWRISSVRPAEGQRRYDAEPAVSTAPAYEYRRRANEQLTEVPVNWSRAVMGPPNQRCWVERQAVPAPSSPNVGGALAGAVIGGILGHQVGGGSGKDAATAVGVISGAAIGSNMGGGSSGVATQDVQRCTTVSGGAPAYYEVSYNYRGTEHRVQMATPPGNKILVNARGEPRG